MATKKTVRVRRDETDMTQLALDALELATTHATRVDPRLTPGLRDGLARDLADFGVVVPGALQAKAEQRAATSEQTEAAGRVKDLVLAIRGSVVAAQLGADVRKGWGVGMKMDERVVKSVLSAGDLVLARGASKPDEARAAGVLPTDLDRLAAELTAARGSDATQESRKQSSKAASAAKNALLARTVAATAKISAAGVLEFTGSDSELAKKFSALVPAKTKRKPSSE